jgi:hypothetical protein
MELYFITNDTLGRTWKKGGSSICLEELKKNTKIDTKIYAMHRIREVAGSIDGTETAILTEILVLVLSSSCQAPESTSHYTKTVSFHTPINY